MLNDFQDDFQKKIFDTDFGWDRDEIKNFWNDNFEDILQSESYILQKLQEYAPSTTQDYKGFFYRILYFFMYKPKNNFYSEKIIDFLKLELEKQRQIDKPEFYPKLILTIFSIGSQEIKLGFYEQEFQEIKNKNFIHSDVYIAFLEIFIEIGKNTKKVCNDFSEVFCQVILFSVDEIISFSIENGWDYFVFLDKEDFNREFLKILVFFDLLEHKDELLYHHKYLSIFTLGKYEIKTERFDFIRKKISESFNENEYKIFEDFVISDIKYALEKYERDIEKNIFLSEAIDILQQRDKKFILKLLSLLEKSKNSVWGLEKIIEKYISQINIEEFISLFKDTHNSMIIFRVYESVLGNNIGLTEIFEKSSFKDELKKIQKQTEQTQEEYKQKQQVRVQKEKEELFLMIDPHEGIYYPKLFQDFVEYSSGNGVGFQIFSKKERQKIDTSVTDQIKTYFSFRDVRQFTEKWLKFVTFEKKAENSYSHCWDARYMDWFLKIGQVLPEVEETLKKHYKTVLLYFPLMYGDEIQKYFFHQILPSQLDTDDIKYILKAYSKDLHPEAKDLRYYHPRNFISLYSQFKESFQGYKEKIAQISLHMISNTEKLEVYYREEYLEIYAEVVGEKKYRRYWNTFSKKYPNFNYFQDILKNRGEKSAEELKEMRFFLTAQTILIEKYAKKSDIAWRIQQFIGVEIELNSRFDDEYPRYRGVTTWSGSGLYEEIEWGSFDREYFAYIFSLKNVGSIDVSKEMLKVLEESFKIKYKEKKELNIYANYLQKVFFKYFEFFDENLVNKEFYFTILKVLEKFDYKYYYTFNLDSFRKKFGVSKLEEEARKKYKEGSKELLALIQKEEKRFSKLENKAKEYEKNVQDELKKKEDEIQSLKDENEKIKKFEEEITELKKYNDIQKTNFPNCIIYVEGKTDKIVLDYILDNDIFYREKKYKVQIIDSCGCRGVTNNINYIKFLDDLNISVLGIYDFDFEGFNEFKDVIARGKSSIGRENIVEESYFLMKTKKEPGKNIYVSLLPVPKNDLQCQVIFQKEAPKIGDGSVSNTLNTESEFEDFGTASLLVLEHLFYGIDIGEKNYKKLINELFDERIGIGIGAGKRFVLKLNDKRKFDFIREIISKEFFDNKTSIDNQRLFANFEPIVRMIDRIASGEFEDKREEI